MQAKKLGKGWHVQVGQPIGLPYAYYSSKPSLPNVGAAGGTTGGGDNALPRVHCLSGQVDFYASAGLPIKTRW
jgi:hypothetical protein